MDHKAVSQMLDGRVGDHRRSSLRYSYNAGSVGLVDGTGYPACSSGVIVFLVNFASSSWPPSRGGALDVLGSLTDYSNCVCVESSWVP
jgi:hypothetical protein